MKTFKSYITEAGNFPTVASAKKAHADKVGTGKFDKKKDPTTGGTIHSVKYDRDTGETPYKLKPGQGKSDQEILHVDTEPLSKFWNKRQVKEDGGMGAGAIAGPTNVVSGGAIAGTGGKGGEPGVYPKKKPSPVLPMKMSRRSPPKM
jgi:hypothetical protein